MLTIKITYISVTRFRKWVDMWHAVILHGNSKQYEEKEVNIILWKRLWVLFQIWTLEKGSRRKCLWFFLLHFHVWGGKILVGWGKAGKYQVIPEDTAKMILGSCRGQGTQHLDKEKGWDHWEINLFLCFAGSWRPQMRLWVAEQTASSTLSPRNWMNNHSKKMSAEGNWCTASVCPWEKHLPGWLAQFGRGSNNTEAVLAVST